MKEKMEEIKLNIKNGRMKLADINWLVVKVEEQQEEIKLMKNKSRFNSFMDIAKENLELQEEVNQLKAENARLMIYKQTYESLRKAGVKCEAK